ncbi:hypothetical protein [Rhodococcus sp. EPR-157]|uniref:hypothetical protein n=1 Tax=Rhodococcus sp. EPR-157 TaxID=1813677 RepID=UPI001E3B8055|nr:hypothetical protein [Rhodococcus sp. EPR-157]
MRNLPKKSLLRRLAVVDLLARTGTTVTAPLDHWACLQLIWNNLIGRKTAEGSPTARTEALLAMSETELKLPKTERAYPRPNPAALDALRTDLLVAPADLHTAAPEFAHDEIRRFATAVCLVRTESITSTLTASGRPLRWSMSAAKLACEGKLTRAANPHLELAMLVAQFDLLGDESTVRWKDVPLEAVLEMPNAYDLLRRAFETAAPKSHEILATFVRITSLHQRHNNMIDVPRGEPIVRLLIEEVNELWSQDNEPFRLLTDWLNAALMEGLPAGNQTRTALREVLLKHWRTYNDSTDPAGHHHETEDSAVIDTTGHHREKASGRRTLPWQTNQPRYIQLLALLGPDIDHDVRACLQRVAAKSPSRLQPAVDLDWSAWGIGSHDPDLLIQLTEAYYIDSRGSANRRGSLRRTGIRDHQPQGFGPLSSPTSGPFWLLTRMCAHKHWIPAVNRMLNHAVNIRCHVEPGGENVKPDSTFTLAISGTERTYVGDSDVWGWYRGNTNGPYPCMSALQAVERWIDQLVSDGAALANIATALLNGCENLAMPALILGATIRHLGADLKTLDRYLVEPLVWELDSIRVNRESISFMRTPDDGITNPERRKWHLRDVAVLLVLRADQQRRIDMKNLGERLLENTVRFDPSDSTARRWAATFDADNLATDPTEGGVLVSINEPADIEKELGPVRADMLRGHVLLELQNKYWIPARQQKRGWTPPTPIEIANDLARVKDLHDNPPEFTASDPYLTIACVASAAVRTAAAGHPEALGADPTFAITSILEILEQTADDAKGNDDALRFENDIGTRAVAAGAIPQLLLPQLAEHISTAGASPGDVASTAATLGSLAATDTCMSFARGFDTVWENRCTDDPCIHLTAYEWVVDLARLCEIGKFDEELQHHPRVVIEGDVLARIRQIRPDRLDTTRLSATIRAIGRAAATDACVAEAAQKDLVILLRCQAHAMVEQESPEHGYFVDDHGAETMTAARALLHRQSRADSTDALLLDYVTILAPATHVFSAFLRDLAVAGAETQELANTAKRTWPTLFVHVLDQVDLNKAIYDQGDSFVDYALSHLIPNHPESTDLLHSEFGLRTFKGVEAGQLLDLISRWLPYAAGRHSCMFELIQLLRQLSIEMQLNHGFFWLEALCLSEPSRQLVSSASLNEWLVDIHTEANMRGFGENWLRLVDRLVYAGNNVLAPYSR